ncbi:SDR family NAD(P)-dependent oxidoreductase [Granulosicoccus sp.]|nr:SDR family NAD(P)-dependent oxidoreductase [Granulosicoccus sp.]
MKLKNKNVVVTGGGSGIGRALCKRFAAENANVVVSDLKLDRAQTTAAEIKGHAVQCDVSNEADIKMLVAEAEKQVGQIDLFCSNAGLFFGEPEHAASASNDVWQTSWEVHVMAHVYAARAVLPSMIERSQGYLLNVASAAGLLSQIGDAAYSTTKHAAVGFAESLSITHRDDGIRVSVLCPQYVATPMLGYDNDASSDVEGVISAEQLADTVIEGIDDERFLILPHPQVADYMVHKAGNYDRWLGGMRKLRRRIIDKTGSTRAKEIYRHM